MLKISIGFQKSNNNLFCSLIVHLEQLLWFQIFLGGKKVRIFLMLFIRTLYIFMPSLDDLTKQMKSSSKLNRLVYNSDDFLSRLSAKTASLLRSLKTNLENDLQSSRFNLSTSPQERNCSKTILSDINLECK